MDTGRIKISGARANPKKSSFLVSSPILNPASKLSMKIWIVIPITVDASS
jgi:hypothetical protein